MLRRLAFLVLATGLLAALAAGPSAAASRTIVPGRSIAGVRLLDSSTTAEALLGHGRAYEVTQPTELPPLMYLRWLRSRVRAGFDNLGPAGHALYLETWSPAFRTARGIRVGSTRAALVAAYPAVRCGTPWFCVLGRQTIGQRVTIFRFRHGRIGTIGVGFIQD